MHIYNTSLFPLPLLSNYLSLLSISPVSIPKEIKIHTFCMTNDKYIFSNYLIKVKCTLVKKWHGINNLLRHKLIVITISMKSNHFATKNIKFISNYIKKHDLRMKLIISTDIRTLIKIKISWKYTVTSLSRKSPTYRLLSDFRLLFYN